MIDSRVKLTNNLGNILKTTRIINNIKSTELAQHLDKSVAYISKLESANLKYIEFDMLKCIFQFLIKDSNENFDKFITKILEKYYIENSSDEVEEWVKKFDIEEIIKTKIKLLKDSQAQQTFNNILSEYGGNVLTYLNKILGVIKLLDKWNSEYTSNYLNEISKSFNIKDTSFILAVLGRGFSKLNNLDNYNKKEFLKNLDDLINRYSKIENDKTKNFIEY